MSQDENRQTKATPSQLAGEHGWSLGAAVNHQWPTPTVRGNDNRKGASPTSGDGLGTAVRMSPTPMAADASRASGTYARGNPTLVGAVRDDAESAWPTPTARDFRSGKTGPVTWAKTNARPLNEVVTASNGAAPPADPLSPDWVETLMGFPAGWTHTDGPPVAVKRSAAASPRARRRVSRSEPQG